MTTAAEGPITEGYDYNGLPNLDGKEVMKTLSAEGRTGLGIYPPERLYSHFGQQLGPEFGEWIEDLMVQRGVDSRIAKPIANRIGTAGLRFIVNHMAAGYAERVLEERAGIAPISAPSAAESEPKEVTGEL